MANKKIDKTPVVKITEREQDVLDALKKLSGKKKNAAFSPADIMLVANVSSSSQVCILLKKLVEKKLVVKIADARYAKA